ncbi:S41 family peptidase [Kitasatospora sp. NPDC058162]|uniref:S41 family peptidase n=1 Tax=Kitasatospora sp. NPDC058162 TaxID=3346362 RepID=UPI0036DD4DB5
MQASYLRFPHLRGDLLTFTAEDCVWAAPIESSGASGAVRTGRAWRITDGSRPVARPRISPDGRHIAFTSGSGTDTEVHLAPVEGGPVRRLTHWGVWRTAVSGWTPDGRVVATTTHGQPTQRRPWGYALPVDGGPAERLPYGPVGDIAFGPRGGVVVSSATMIRESADWKGYRGGLAGKLWSAPDGGGLQRILAALEGSLECPMWVGDRIAFLSDHEGSGALYSCLPDGTGLRRHTAPADRYARQAATDGRRIVHARAGDLHLLEHLDAEPAPITVRLGGGRAGLRPYPVRSADHLGDVRPDHTGRSSVVEVRGTVHLLPHRPGPVRLLTAEPGVRARLPRAFRADGRPMAAWVTDAGGEDALECAPASAAPGTPPGDGTGDGTGDRRRVAAGQLGRVLELEVSPDGRQAAVACHDGRVLLVEWATGEVRELAAGRHGDATGLAFSPDSRRLAWSQAGPRPLRWLRIADTRTGEVLDATALRFNDHSPAFTPDGAYLVFLSERVFDPVPDTHSLDLSFPLGCRPYLMALAADTPSPFLPWTEEPGTQEPGTENPSRGERQAAVPPTRIDPEGIEARTVPFPVEAGRYSALRTAGSKVLWLRQPMTGLTGAAAATAGARPIAPVLEGYDLARRAPLTPAEGVTGFAVSGDGARLVLRRGGGLHTGPADGGATEPVDLDRVRVWVEPSAEWRQMYAEAGRLMRENFWRADMSGVDWDGALDRYRPLLDRIASQDELADLLWEVHGELGTSHAFVAPPVDGGDPRLRPGLLGADLVRDAGGRWRIARVLPSEPSDPRAASPLAAPGVAVAPGDVLVAVGGRPVDPVTGPAPLLLGTAGQPVELTVLGASGDRRPVVVVPLADDEPLRYHDWVAGRRALVHRDSGGRLGYLHVPDMLGHGWAQFHRDLRTEAAREGLVVDLRDNRGGSVSQLIVEQLARRTVGWSRARWAQPVGYPRTAPRGPVAVLVNEFTGSDGEVAAAALQALGVGPLVGVRTSGAVIGIDLRYTLVDGTGVTQPKSATWLQGYGWEVENRGVDPDVESVRTPQDWQAGRDPQLDTAVRLVLTALATAPDRTPPPLPAPPSGGRRR